MRECGECQACCWATAVNAGADVMGQGPLVWEKPAHERCEKLGMFGCSDYEGRPDACALFECLWLRGEFGEEYRPDKSGIVVWTEFVPEFNAEIFSVSEASPGSRNNPLFDALVQSLKNKMPVMVNETACKKTVYFHDLVRKFIDTAPPMGLVGARKVSYDEIKQLRLRILGR